MIVSAVCLCVLTVILPGHIWFDLGLLLGRTPAGRPPLIGSSAAAALSSPGPAPVGSCHLPLFDLQEKINSSCERCILRDEHHYSLQESG